MSANTTFRPGTAGSARGQCSDWTDKKASVQTAKARPASQASGRRRGIDPTTCDRDGSVAEMEVEQALQSYKRSSGRMFPTWSEVLEVLVGIGYQKGAEVQIPGLC